MTEKELMIQCIPQITEMALIIKDMTAEQYQEFKRGHLEEVGRTCPKALSFISNIFALIEQELGKTTWQERMGDYVSF